jgi:putative phosphoribosyl transferase
VEFSDRREAGAALAGLLAGLGGQDVVVLALPRGGVPVGYEVARALDAPLDVIGVRKIGAPGRPELGLGAIAEGEVRVLDQRIIDALDLGPSDIAPVELREREELERRLATYRGGRGLPDLTGRTVVIVDDGLATGGTARAACRAARACGPQRVVMAAPVAAPQAVRLLEQEADEVVCVSTPDPFVAVGAWYRRFDQTSDEEVLDLLAAARTGTGGGR